MLSVIANDGLREFDLLSESPKPLRESLMHFRRIPKPLQ